MKTNFKRLFALVFAALITFMLIVPASATMAPGIAGGGAMGASDDTAGATSTAGSSGTTNGGNDVGVVTSGADMGNVSNGIVTDADPDVMPGDPEGGIVSGTDTTAAVETTKRAETTSAVTSAADTTSSVDGSSSGMGNVWGIIIAIIIILAIVLLLFAFIPKKK